MGCWNKQVIQGRSWYYSTSIERQYPLQRWSVFSSRYLNHSNPILTLGHRKKRQLYLHYISNYNVALVASFIPLFCNIACIASAQLWGIRNWMWKVRYGNEIASVFFLITVGCVFLTGNWLPFSTSLCRTKDWNSYRFEKFLVLRAKVHSPTISITLGLMSDQCARTVDSIERKLGEKTYWYVPIQVQQNCFLLRCFYWLQFENSIESSYIP